uniref:Uncharacterized protein n=1 Tax=Lactuca sativa TaxID=4236 RepID=A0A9R1WQT7_LACSA|nr:hypothetical protein LSAT_V11C100008520 [Lactuca sativa]
MFRAVILWPSIRSVPAYGVLISGHSLLIDESSMTGESKIVTIVVVAVPQGLPLVVTLTTCFEGRYPEVDYENLKPPVMDSLDVLLAKKKRPKSDP